MSAPITTREYFQNVWDSLATTFAGMRITGKYLMQKPITVQYPDERLPIPDRYRGIHYLEQEKCINCLACARACPIDCIEMDAIRHGKELEWVLFTLDYQKCMFCELCVYPCPKDCIHMGTEFAFVSFDRSELKHDLLSYRGMSREARIRKREADIKKAEKEAAKAATAGAPAPAPEAPAVPAEPVEASEPEEASAPEEAPTTPSWETPTEDATEDVTEDVTDNGADPETPDPPTSPF